MEQNSTCSSCSHHGGPLKKVLMLMLIAFLATLIVNNVKKNKEIGFAPRTPHTITIAGTGKVTATPTIATTNVGLVTEKADVASAQTENTNKMNALISALKSLGIDSADIKTAQYQINPKYTYDQKNGSTINGYSVTQSVEVKIRDLTKISAVLAKAGDAGANQVSGIQFTIDEPKNLEAQARELAVQDAKDKAEKLAATLGVRISRVVDFSEVTPNNMPGPVPMMYAKDAAGVGGGVPAPDVQSGSVEVHSDVAITYEIQ
ncbi:MAG: SIMPL domain-containing protein [Candidatus Magasanikbacteria bacterium]|nr:SIMPL domain-containing protein [Candidatus Magasanikbacteria bacterium]